jgi:hypothetical protein
LHNGESTKKVRKKVRKKSSKKSLLKKFKILQIVGGRGGKGGEGREGKGREGKGGEGGWRIVIPMPEAINFVDGRRQKYGTVHVVC